MKNGFFIRVVTPALALIGLACGAYYIEVVSKPTIPENVQIDLPPTSPFEESISGTGIIEANSRNVDVGSSLSGVVSDVFVTEGDLIEKDAPLFKLDDRTARSNVAEQKNAVTAAAAQVDEAKTSLDDQKDQLARADQLKPGISITVDRLERLRFAVRSAEAKLGVARSNLASAESRRDSALVELKKLTVTAPIAGRVLKSNIRPGEYVQAGAKIAPIVMGNDKPLYVRVSIDENDLWRFKKTNAAEGSLRSNRAIHFPLQLVRAVPYVVPKMSLTGSTSERVDTRVLEVLYKVGDTDENLIIGQQVDVFIAAKSK